MIIEVSADEIWYVPFIITRFPFHARRGFGIVARMRTRMQSIEHKGGSSWTSSWTSAWTSAGPPIGPKMEPQINENQ